MQQVADRYKNIAYYALGLGFLTLSFAKHKLQGYSTPTPLKREQTDLRVQHIIEIVDRWLDGLAVYGLDIGDVEGKDVVELGPGSDFGTGLLLMAMGAKSYTAYDRFDNVKHDEALYRRLLSFAGEKYGISVDVDQFVSDFIAGRCQSRLVVDENFDFGPLRSEGSRFDLILSNAAFEHFDDPADVISNLDRVSRKHAIFVAWIDLKTHSRFVRQRDPLNIYRFSDSMYKAFYFPGQPNRFRPSQYVRALRGLGWRDAKLAARISAEVDYVASTHRFLANRFQSDDSEMDVLSGAVVARKEGSDPVS